MPPAIVEVELGKQPRTHVRAFVTMAFDARVGKDEPAVLVRVPPWAVQTVAKAAASNVMMVVDGRTYGIGP
eukprot:11162892-Lingulodinium_polyedra.AAC.1